MSKEKFLVVAAAAFEITKMVLVIAAHTTCKLITVGKDEIVKQYQIYQQKATPQQLEAMRMVKDMTLQGTSLAKKNLKTATKKVEEARKNIPDPKRKK